MKLLVKKKYYIITNFAKVSFQSKIFPYFSSFLFLIFFSIFLISFKRSFFYEYHFIKNVHTKQSNLSQIKPKKI